MDGASETLRTSLRERLLAVRGDAPAAFTDVLLQTVETPAGPLLRARPRSFDAVREAEALAGPGRGTPYWASAWPSGTALARAVAAAGPERLRGRRVLEVGCGLALPSVAAARAGGRTVATDRSPEAVVFAAHNLALNDATDAEARVADWARADVLGDEWDLLLGADVLYTFDQADELHALVDRIVARDGEVWLADPGRAGCKQFLQSVKAQWLVRSEPAPDDGTVTLHRLRRRPRRR